MNDSGLVHGFADKSEQGYKFQVRCEIINTNSKVNQSRKIWWINDKRSSAQKVHNLLREYFEPLPIGHVTIIRATHEQIMCNLDACIPLKQDNINRNPTNSEGPPS